jgi:hypothetical protein
MQPRQSSPESAIPGNEANYHIIINPNIDITSVSLIQKQ